MKLVVQFYAAVAAAGALGSMLRYFVGTTCGRLLGTAFPIGTLVINITGSLFLGWFMTVIQNRVSVSDTFRLAVATGFVGAYTTFSTFAYETNDLVEQGAAIKATANIAASLTVGLLAVRLGIYIASR